MQKRQDGCKKDKRTNKARKVGISGFLRFLPLFVGFVFLSSPLKQPAKYSRLSLPTMDYDGERYMNQSQDESDARSERQLIGQRNDGEEE
jgi:hypothetical protein